NVIKYTGRREHARIEVASEVHGVQVVYRIQDNGVGFDMAYADQLFRVFHRLHRSDEYEGTGIGLALVQRAIYRHGGRVWAEAEPDRGATFSFTLGGEEAASSQAATDTGRRAGLSPPGLDPAAAAAATPTPTPPVP